MPIRSLGRYEIRAELGRGTMGVVYRGHDPVLDREIALKTVDLPGALSADRRRKFLDRFFLEAKIAGKLIHPNIVVTHDAATDETTEIPFIAMELVSGGSLHARLSKGPLGWEEALRLAEPLARALDYAHELGVVHRDIKPANVLLSAAGVPKIADFGIAKLPNIELTQTGTVLGTPYFMSPEQLEGGDLDGRSDLFSLGALLYNLLTGSPPFRGTDLASITQQVLYKSPTPPSELVPEIPHAVDGVLARAMAKKRDERYRTGEELATDLERVRRGEAPLNEHSFGEKTIESKPTTVLPAAAASPAEPEEAPARAEPEEAPASSSFLGCSGMFVLLAAVTAGAVYRWDDVIRLAAPFREQHEEVERREQLRTEADVLLSEARDHLAHARFGPTEELIERALAISRDAKDGGGEASSLLWRGRLEAERGEWSRARADLDAAESVYGIYGLGEGRKAAITELANLERDLGNFDLASSLYERAGPGAEAIAGRALMALMQGELDAAERGFESSGDWLYLGAVAWVRGDTKKAEAAWSRIPENDAVEELRSQSDEDGESLFRKLCALEPSTPRREERCQRMP